MSILTIISVSLLLTLLTNSSRLYHCSRYNCNLFKSVFPSDSLIPTLTPTQTRGHSRLSPNPPTSVGSLLEDQGVPDDGDILEDAQRKEPRPRVIQMIPVANISPRYSNCQHEKVPQKRTVSLIFIILEA